MKRTLLFLLLLWAGTHCRDRSARNAPQLDAARLTGLNQQLGEKALAPRVLVNRIEISCQDKRKALGRDLTRLEYLAVLRDEHFAALPEEMQGHRQALDEMTRLLTPDTLSQLLATGREWSLPLPNGNGPTRVSITREGLAESRRQGLAVLRWLEDEKLVDEAEREQIGETLEKSVLLFPHQAYDLILRGLGEPDAAAVTP
ncbi:MAG: hypothetical protein AVDCRST_MAG56-1528 [uncultured Cytophagales bacterium]|uniref:Uncharacterized protein n=1 Tax=uncultured Cytophagales bacterium TaxID=158755 RepID=A0A6J4I769_9SPHI|nr:MAG: hypothetical protein AVDCRST_MAG56-1528 [uncultured Cytophagales bacterium]